MMKLITVLLFFTTSTFAFPANTTIFHPQKIESRIIGGQTARSAQFPYAAAIYATGGGRVLFCGGSVINNQWILTSAQCLTPGATFRIQLGSNSLTATDNNRVILTTTNSISHPDYNPITLENDIGLIKLRLPVVFNQYLRQISLPTKSINDYTPVTVIGWGPTSDFGNSPVDLLNYVTVTSITERECRETYGDQITEHMICVAGNYNEGACQSDSGGPMIEFDGNVAIQVGIHSFGSQNGCESTDPSGFTRTYPYIDWINENIN